MENKMTSMSSGIQLTPEMQKIVRNQKIQDFLFHKITLFFASLVLIVLAGIIISLFITAWPTLKEFGYKVEARALYGILAPKDTPKAVVDAIFLAAKKAGEKYQMQIIDSLTALGAQPALLDPKEYAAYVADQKAMFTKAKQTLKLSE